MAGVKYDKIHYQARFDVHSYPLFCNAHSLPYHVLAPLELCRDYGT